MGGSSTDYYGGAGIEGGGGGEDDDMYSFNQNYPPSGYSPPSSEFQGGDSGEFPMSGAFKVLSANKGGVPFPKGGILATNTSGSFSGSPRATSGRPGPKPPSRSGGRSSLGSRMGSSHLSDSAGDQARPMTAVSAAGFNSSGRPGTGARSFDPLNASSGRGPPPPLQKKQDQGPEAMAKELESRVHAALEQSAVAASKGDLRLALERAKDAQKKEKNLTKHKEQYELQDQINNELTFAVSFNLANQLHANGMDTEAITQYNAITRNKAFQQSGRLKVNMGNIYFEQKKYNPAIKMYRMALDQISNSWKDMRYKIMRNIAVAFIHLNQFQDAIETLEAIMEGVPDVRSALNLILCYFALGNKEKMKEVFSAMLSIKVPAQKTEEEDEAHGDEDAVDLDQPRPPHVINDPLRRELKERQKLSERYIIMSGKLIAPVVERDFLTGYDWVVEALRSSGRTDLANEMEISKALTFMKNKDFEKAVETLKDFERKDQTMATSAATNLSFLYFLEKDYKNAELYADLAIRADRYNAKALVNRGNCLMPQNELDTCKAYYEEALSVEADCVEAMYNLGLVYKKMLQPYEAMEAFMKLHQIIPHNPEVLFQIATVYEMMGEPAKAADWLKRLTTLVPSDPTVLAHMGAVHAKQDDMSLAFHYYLESYRYYPCNMEVIEWLGRYYVERGVYEKALQFFQRASQLLPADVRWPLMVASCHRRIGAYQPALEIYKEIHQKAPDNVECLRYLVHVCGDLGMKDEVQEYVSKLRKAEQELQKELGDAYSAGGIGSNFDALGTNPSGGTSDSHDYSGGGGGGGGGSSAFGNQSTSVSMSYTAPVADSPMNNKKKNLAEEDWGDEDVGEDLLPF